MAGIIKDREDAAKQRDANKKKIGELTSLEKDKQAETAKTQEMLKNAERDIVGARDEKRGVATQMKEFMFAKNEIDAEIGALKTKYKAEIESLEKLEPIFQTLKKIRGLIREKNIQGYKGLLIDFIEFDPKIASIVDLAAKSKLFSIIVEDLESAKEILALNNQIKGGVINIYPLSIIEQVKQEKQRNYP